MISATNTATIHSEIIKISSKLPIDALIEQLRDILSVTWAEASRKALIGAIRDLEAISGPVTPDEFGEIEARISEALGKDLAVAVKDPVGDYSKAAYLMGINAVWKELGGTALDWSLWDTKSLNILTRNTLFWIGDYYDLNIQEAIRSSMQDYFMGGYNRQQIATLMRIQFKDMIAKPRAYWDLLADHMCTKIREIGRVAGYEKAGIKYVQFRAHLDDRTTKICKHMHGRIIAVSDMRNQVDGYLAACETQDKEKIKKAWPWIKDSAAKGNTSDMIGKKVSLPPLHARCRSITVAYFEDVRDATLHYGDDVDRKDRNVIDQWTAPEHRNFVDYLKFRAKSLPYNEADFKHDIIKAVMEKHADKEMGVTPEQYLKISRDTVKNADRVFCHSYKGEVQYSFVSLQNKMVSVVDRNGMIRSAYYHGDKPMGIEKCLKSLMKKKRTELRFTG